MRCAVLSAVLLAGCAAALPPATRGGAGGTGGTGAAKPTFDVPQARLATPLVLVAYGDMRFTDPGASLVSQPFARRALVAKVAEERPAAVLINGDVPLRGVAEDYDVFHRETAVWRYLGLRVYPALGNHEFAQCEESACLDLWWGEFPALRGHRWYSVALGGQVLCIALDSDASLLPGSEQRTWLEAQVAGRGAGVRFVVIVMHHPPLADVQTAIHVDHNPRANESALAGYLGGVARAQAPATRFLVVAGHIHNYERIERDGVTYLVSGGGGAAPYEVERTTDDLYRTTGLIPNYHYVRLELRDGRMTGEMVRLADYAAAEPHEWSVADRFEIGP
jgi:hypothetical protein